MKTALSLFAFGVLAGPGVASADPEEVYETDTYAWNEPYLQTGVGVGITVGGGIGGFTDQTMRNTLTSNVQGLWDARVSLGTHIPLGIDLSYLGQAGNMRTFTGTSNGTLVGTTFEAALRFNVLPHMAFNPYAFAGIGYQRYDLTSQRIATSDSGIKGHDNLVEFPMGAGVSYRDRSGWLVDLRGTFRAVPDSTLVLDQREGVFASAHWWEASGAVGYEF